MARPRKQGLDYFPFDCDFFSDEKIVAIAGEFGLKGEIAAVKLLCAIYRNGYFIEWSEMLRMKMLSYLPGVSAELLDQIVNRLIRWGFFDKALFDSAKVLTSEGIQRRFFEATRNRVRKDSLPYILSFRVENPSPKGVSYGETPAAPRVSYEKSTQSKVNKIKISPDGDRKSQPPPAPPESDMAFMNLGLDGQIDRLRGDSQWAEAVCMKFSMDAENLWKLIDGDFTGHCIREGKHHQSMQDLKSHINRWINRQKQLTANGNNQPTTDAGRGRTPGKDEFRAHIAARLGSPERKEPDLSGYY